MVGVKNLEDKELLELYGKLMEELRRRKLVRSSNNPVSDYAERVLMHKHRLTR